MIRNFFKRKKDVYTQTKSLKIKVNQELNDKILLINELLKSYLKSKSLRTPLGYNLSDKSTKNSIKNVINISNIIDRISKCIVSDEYPLITSVLEKSEPIFQLLLNMITDIHWISIARDIQITKELSEEFSKLDLDLETVIQQRKLELEEKKLEYLSALQVEKEAWLHLNNSLKEFNSVQNDNLNHVQNILNNTNELLTNRETKLQIVSKYNTNMVKIKNNLEKNFKSMMFNSLNNLHNFLI